MLEILHFIFSNFWIWLGFTISATLICDRFRLITVEIFNKNNNKKQE